MASGNLDVSKTAFLTLDLQYGILDRVELPDSVIQKSSEAAEFARKSGLRVIHVGLGFSPGHPEIPANAEESSIWHSVKQKNEFVIGTKSARVHSDVFRDGETMVYKHRASAFYQNHLDMILRNQGIQHIVIGGIATSGIVLSTVRYAYDLDYKITVLEDMCFDRDPDVHEILIKKVFTKQANVKSVADFIAGK